MAGYAAIAEVGETLVGLLRDRIDETEGSIGVDRSEVGLISPGEMGENGDLRLSLYLYRVTESGELNNAERTQVGEETYREPPLALEVWTGLYQCYDRLAGKKPETPEQRHLRERADDAFNHICRIDARYALSLAST